MSCFIQSGNVGGSGGDIYEDAACWVAFFFCRGMPGGRGYRSGQGLRGIQLGSVRVERKRDAADFKIYTDLQNPGSKVGISGSAQFLCD